ncbi:MAG: hypothetical protein Q8P59_01435, partial [Dehalococcoidia bacterium]|nr:hypothetical protein [Dehalococcoidia bacterium]
MARTLRVLQVAPVPERLNPYVYLLARSLEAEGAKCTIWNHFSLRRFLAGRHRVDILHFHWAEHLCSPSRPARTWKDFLQLSIGLVYAKATRCRLVYTVHNLDPHGGTTARVSSMAHRLLLAVADGLHVHDEYSRLRLQERVKGRRPVFPIPHGHYIGAYPNRCSREEARARLGLEGEAFAYLFLGQMRPHKGIEDLVVAFQHI